MKPKLVCIGETFLNGQSGHHLPLFSKYFDISNYDHTVTYDSKTTFIYRHDEARHKVKQYEGISKFIADGIWEMNFFCDSNFGDDTLGLICNGYSSHDRVLSVPKWFWFEEHYSQQHKKALIKDMPFEHPKSKTFLMQIGDAKPPRTKLFSLLNERNLLDNATYSFLAQGIGLEGPVNDYDPNVPPFPQRAYRPEWYNETHFTLVPECMQEIVDGQYYSVFITEKTMKPIMYGHPFIILGDKHTLEVLEIWGFQTFPELFNQKYDREKYDDKRITMVVDQVGKFKPADVKEKVLHNFKRFWDRDLVEKLITAEMIIPIKQFISRNKWEH